MNDTPTPRTDSLVNVLAGWEDRNGAMAAITPDEWDDLFYPVTQACITQSPRQLRRDLAAAQERVRELGRSYRCFHCKQVFTDEHLAREHFGDTTEKMARCMALLEAGSAGGPHSPFPPVVLALDRAERAEAESSKWQSAFHDAVNKGDSAESELVRVKAEREATLELLAELHAMVKGECPSLLNEDIGGDARTALAIEEMLSKRDAAIAAKGDK